jgi:hypothetical protein
MHPHTHTLCMFVCFLFSFHHSSSPSITETASCIEYDYERQRCVCMCEQLVFLADFLSCFLHLLFLFFFFFFFYSSVSLHLRTRKIRTQKNRAIKKRISFNSEIAYMISLSFVLFFPFFTQIYNYNRKERLTLPQQLSHPMIYDRYRRRKAIDKIILIDYRQ